MSSCSAAFRSAPFYHRDERLAFGLRVRFGLARQVGGKRDGPFDCVGHACASNCGDTNKSYRVIKAAQKRDNFDGFRRVEGGPRVMPVDEGPAIFVVLFPEPRWGRWPNCTK